MPTPDPIAELNLAPPLVPDGAFGRYRLFAKLGSGGQADVFLAIARGTLGVDKLVVIKRARPGLAADAALLQVFLDEARLTLRLNHPNLVHTYEVGQERGAHFLSMEYVEGLSLKDLFRCARTRSFEPAIWLRVIADALGGLQHAHSLRDYDGKPLGIVHRDISPHNLVVSYDGVTKLLDFGIATSCHAPLAEPGVVTGKVAYMAPEQALGHADRRSDVFAMGVVLWEMLSGRRLFDGDAAAILHRLAHEPIPRLASALGGVDPDLDDLVARALEKDAAARYQSANEMRQAIERYLRRTGHLVRELEVADAMSAAFHEVRAELQARIQDAMAGRGARAPVGSRVGSPVASIDCGVAPRPAARRGTVGRARGRVRAALPQAHTARRRGTVRTRGLAVIAALAVAAAAAAIVLRATRGADHREVRVARAAVGPMPAGPPPDRPPCPAPIRVRVMYDMTGDTKEVGTAAGKGEYDYLRAINAAGGIRGCPLDIDVQDTRYDKGASLDAYRAWRARPDWPEVSTLFVQGTPMTQALGPLAAEDHKVIVSGAYAGELAAGGPTTTDVAVPSLSGAFAEASVLVRKQSAGYPSVFFQGTDYTTAARVAANFAWRQGARRMAFFYCSTSAFCTDPVDGAKTFLQLLGGTRIGRDLFIELGDDAPTIERKVLRFFQDERLHKASHPDYEVADWIWFGNTSPNTALLGRALKKARDQLGIELHVIGDNWSVDESLYRRCGEPCVGFHVVQPFALFGDPTASGTRALLADHARYRELDGDPPDGFRTVQYVYGRVAVATWRIAVERLLDQGKPVTGLNLRTTFEAFRNVDVEGFATIGYTAADHRPQSGARVSRIGARGRMETVGQPLSLSLQSGWLGW